MRRRLVRLGRRHHDRQRHGGQAGVACGHRGGRRKGWLQQRLALTSADQVLPWEGNLAEDPGNGSRNDSDTPVTAHLATGPLPAIDAGPGS